MQKSKLLQVRLSEELLEKLDELVRLGLFKSRSEAVSEALRRLILEYSAVTDDLSMTVALYMLGRLERNLGPGDKFEIDEAEAKRNIERFFGTSEVEEVIDKVRGRKI